MCDTSSDALAGLADQLGWPGLLTAAVDGLVDVPTDELSEDELAREMAAVKREATRLESRLAVLFDARSRRAVLRGRDAAGGDVNAGVRAARQLEQDVAGELGIGNGEAKRIAKAGRAISKDPEAAAAAKDGAVSAEHLRVLDETLRDLDDLDLARRLRAELLAKAAVLDLYAFRRVCRRTLAEADQAAAVRAEDRRHARRSAKTFETDDGMLGLSARLTGLGAETVATALDAYRRPDADDQRRRPEQRTADALVDMATVALRHIDSTSHGHPPQLLVTIDRDRLLAGRGVAETVWTGPLPASTVRRLLGDAQVTTITTGRELSTRVVSHTRTVPAGLWRLLVARDQGCIAAGCDVPAGWCQVVHLHVDHQPGGRLSEANAALVCDRHHDAYDRPHRPLVAIWRDGRPVLVRRSDVPDDARLTPPDHLVPPDGLQGPVPGRPVPVIDPATREPTGRWLPPAPAAEGPVRSTTAGASNGATRPGDTRDTTIHATTGAVTARAPAARGTTSGGAGPTGTDRTDHDTTDRTDHDADGYRRHRSAAQTSLLAEPQATYQVRDGPPGARRRRRGPVSRGPGPPRGHRYRPSGVTRRAVTSTGVPAGTAQPRGEPRRRPP